jgi:hypothetical protein
MSLVELRGIVGLCCCAVRTLSLHHLLLSLSRSLTFWSPVASMCTTCCNKQYPWILYIRVLCISFDSYNKQGLFAWTEFTDWSVHLAVTQRLYARQELNFTVIQKNYRIQAVNKIRRYVLLPSRLVALVSHTMQHIDLRSLTFRYCMGSKRSWVAKVTATGWMAAVWVSTAVA